MFKDRMKLTDEEKKKINEEILKLHEDNEFGHIKIERYFQERGITVPRSVINRTYDPDYASKRSMRSKKRYENYKRIISSHSNEILELYKQRLDGKPLKEIIEGVRRIIPSVHNYLSKQIVLGLEEICSGKTVHTQREATYYLGKTTNEIKESLNLPILRERRGEDKLIEYLRQRSGYEDSSVIIKDLGSKFIGSLNRMHRREKIRNIRPPFSSSKKGKGYLIWHLPEAEEAARKESKEIGIENLRKSCEKIIKNAYRDSYTIKRTKMLIPFLQKYLEDDSVFTTEDLMNESGVNDKVKRHKTHVAKSLIDLLQTQRHGSLFNYNQFYSFSQQSLEDFKQLNLSLKA
jgi:hypothetical protein